MIPHETWALRGRAACAPDGVRPAAVLVRGERIAAVLGPDDVPARVPVVDAGDRLVLPGLVDTHVHVNEPGRTDWEGFATATRAAAAGGITTLIDMPLNSVPATTKASALEKKRRSGQKQCRVDVGFLGGVVPGNVGDLPQLWADGVFGFKCFLVPSGVNEFHHVSVNDLRHTMPMLAQLRAPLLVHAELPAPIE